MNVYRFVLVFSLLTAGLVFGFAGGDGTVENPYQISTVEHLEAVNSNLSAHYVLNNDIDLSGQTYDRAVIAPNTDYSSNEFTGTVFTGSFDGAGFKILNLSVDASAVTENYPYFLGLFGKSAAEVRNLTIENAQITGASDFQYLGILCGMNYQGAIENCVTAGSVSGGNVLGGLCGGNHSGTIKSCSAEADVSGSDAVGGLCGGLDNGTIKNCYATSSVSGDTLVGGLSGGNQSGTIEKCYSVGSVSGYSMAGGLCGANDGTITGCFWDKDTSGMTTSSGGTGLTTAEMKDINNFLNAGWDFESETVNGTDNIWTMPNDDYPQLTSNLGGGDNNGSNPADLNGDGLVDIFDFAIFAENWLAAQ